MWLTRRRTLIVVAVIVISSVLLGVGLLAIVSSLDSAAWPHGIAFQSDLNGRDLIYVIDPDSQKITQMSASAADEDRYPAWSPDGNRLAYSSGSPQGDAIYVLDDSGRRPITEAGGDTGQPRWSPDGKQITYYTTAKEGGQFGMLRVINADGAAGHPVFPNDPALRSAANCFDGFPGGWTGDAQRIVYRGSVRGTAAICSVQLDGTDVRTLITGPGSVFDPALSPDRSKIVYSAEAAGHAQIYLMNADGTGQHPLINDQADDKNPSWSPDGNWIAFSSNMDGQHYHIYIVRLDGSGLTQLTAGDGDDKWPSWSASSG